MKSKTSLLRIAKRAAHQSVLILCVIAVVVGSAPVLRAQDQSTAAPSAAKIPADQLDSLVAPIALYPDPLLAQTLAAATYPLEVIQLSQWLERNPNLKDKALADAVAKQPWDPSVQAMAGLPDVVKRLADDIQWTTDLGNAFLAQQSDVMDAVQRMRKKAKENENLTSGEQIKVETRVVETKEVIVIEQANPQVVYVPSYNPVVVYGAPIYPYPPIYYPPAGYYAAGMALSFGAGMAMGAMWSGGWGYGCGWGNNDIDINVNNNFNRNYNRNTNISGSRNVNSNKWQHNSSHRGGTPYSNRSTANKYGGMSRGDSLSSRQSSARQQVNRQGGNMQSSRPSSSQYGSRPSSSQNRSSQYSRPSSSQYSGRSSSGSQHIGGRDMSRSPSSSNGEKRHGQRFEKQLQRRRHSLQQLPRVIQHALFPRRRRR